MKRDQDGANEWQRELIMQISAHKYNQYIEKGQFKCCERGWGIINLDCDATFELNEPLKKLAVSQTMLNLRTLRK